MFVVTLVLIPRRGAISVSHAASAIPEDMARSVAVKAYWPVIVGSPDIRSATRLLGLPGCCSGWGCKCLVGA